MRWLRLIKSYIGSQLRHRLAVANRPDVKWEVLSPSCGPSWQGRNVVVTGSAGLLGSAVVSALVKRGASVYAIDQDDKTLYQLATGHGAGSGPRTRINLPPHEVFTYIADLNDEDAVARVATEIGRRANSLHALIHCIGGNDFRDSSLSLNADQWHRVIGVNLIAPALMTNALIPLLAHVPFSGVVMLTSIHGRMPSKWFHYAAAKAGLTKLTQDLAACLAPRTIRVNAISSSWFTSVGEDGAVPNYDKATLTGSAIPVEAVVNAVLFLADPTQSPCITGQELAVDAGALSP